MLGHEDALEPARELGVRIPAEGRGERQGRLPLLLGLGRAAARAERPRQQQPSLRVPGIAAHGTLEPEGGRRRIALDEQRPPEVERQIDRGGLRLDRLPQQRRGAPARPGRAQPRDRAVASAAGARPLLRPSSAIEHVRLAVAAAARAARRPSRKRASRANTERAGHAGEHGCAPPRRRSRRRAAAPARAPPPRSKARAPAHGARRRRAPLASRPTRPSPSARSAWDGSAAAAWRSASRVPDRRPRPRERHVPRQRVDEPAEPTSGRRADERRAQRAARGVEQPQRECHVAAVLLPRPRRPAATRRAPRRRGCWSRASWSPPARRAPPARGGGRRRARPARRPAAAPGAAARRRPRRSSPAARPRALRAGRRPPVAAVGGRRPRAPGASARRHAGSSICAGGRTQACARERARRAEAEQLVQPVRPLVRDRDRRASRSRGPARGRRAARPPSARRRARGPAPRARPRPGRRARSPRASRLAISTPRGPRRPFGDARRLGSKRPQPERSTSVSTNGRQVAGVE